ncbi:hypothetical protein BHM03_00010273 [Ensete ventricosum]|uniref:Uncharacterized protein n=1 Tax=Ensete ventricosum TaxID=4639 RepID=A0A426ZRS1_ENSVE|nr:hypothetical protein B296_00040085 [Ensete ventricosum]RZR72091.1 hypothetical protein BHM03_00010273 [Ensete ventricosum]
MASAAAGGVSVWHQRPCLRWRTPVSSASNKVAFVKKTVSSHDIVIFSKSYCPTKKEKQKKKKRCSLKER